LPYHLGTKMPQFLATLTKARRTPGDSGRMGH
jgi:hypothetical protein